MGSICSTKLSRRGMCRIFVGKPERKRPLGRLRRRWEDDIKLCLRLIWLKIRSSERDNEHSWSIKCLEILEWLRDWRLFKKGSAPWS
jgi:hypothetical protein